MSSEMENVINSDSIVSEAFWNGYYLVTKKKSFDELMAENDMLLLPFQSEDTFREKSIQNLIEYFETTEEYEICSELLKIKKEKGCS